MRTRVAAACCVLVLALAGCTATGAIRAEKGPSGPSRPSSVDEPLYGIEWDGRPAALVRLHPTTLRPYAGSRVGVEDFTDAWSFSPDRSRVVLARKTYEGFPAKIRFVDVARGRTLRAMNLHTPGYVVATAWPSPDRVLVVVQRTHDRSASAIVRLVDPAGRRTLANQKLTGEVQGIAHTPQGLVLLVAPVGRMGHPRLAVARADGTVRTVRLRHITAGAIYPREDTENNDPIFRTHQPGLAVDTARMRAFVVDADHTVAKVDLRTLTATARTTHRPTSALGLLRRLFETPALAKGMNGPIRHAVWLGHGRLAVAGTNYRTTHGREGDLTMRSVPAGLTVIDTQSWTAHVIDAHASDLAYADGVIAAYGSAYDSAGDQRKGTGLTAYTPDGAKLYHRFGQQTVWTVTARGDTAYVNIDGAAADGARPTVLDLGDGRVLHTLDRGSHPGLLLPSTP
ncbi:MAG: hypothetical protein ACRDN9_05050 [Streptosporangiaceae bacterium]